MDLKTDLLASDSRIGALAWLRRLRWAAIGAQATTLILTSEWLHLSIQALPLCLLFLLSAASNVALSYLPETLQRKPSAIACVLLGDVLLQTCLLIFSGGPENPFSILYLVPVVLSAVLLDRVWALGLAGVSIVLFASLFAMDSGSEMHHATSHSALTSHSGALSSHLFGMWIAYSLVAFISAYCITRISEELRQQVRQNEANRLRQQRLASLTTLAAGAAHELATPLGTMAIAIGEMKQSLRKHSAAAELLDDIHLIDSQLMRCKEIIAGMSGYSGETNGELPTRIRIAELSSQVVAEMSSRFGKRVIVESLSPGSEVTLPVRTVLSAVSALTKNALEASPPEVRVSIRILSTGEDCRFEVIDSGMGMDAETLSRIGEPFFTTKSGGRGMGLGVFLATLTAENLGGRLSFASVKGKGTLAELRLPLSEAAI